MSKGYIYQSSITSFIDGFLKEKRSMGYDYSTEEMLLRRFDQYCVNSGLAGNEISREFLSDWMKQSDTEGHFYQAKRISVVRQLLFYMASIGVNVYIPSDFCHFEKKLPHILCHEELTAFFDEVDAYRPQKRYYRLANEYRVLFRMLYCLGLRNSECSGLPMESFDPGSGKLTIFNAKGHKDRIIYMPEDLLELCREYICTLVHSLGFQPRWMFPGLDPENPIFISTVDRKFSEFWSRTSFAASCNDKPVPHDLRFTFVVDRINQWIADGIDVPAMMPYLSRHLGHKSPDETYYYYHLVKEGGRIIHEKSVSSRRIIPEVIAYEQE